MLARQSASILQKGRERSIPLTRKDQVKGGFRKSVIPMLSSKYPSYGSRRTRPSTALKDFD